MLEDPRRIRRSRSAPRRAAVLVGVQVLMIAHVVQWLVTGRSVSPLEPSEAMDAVKYGVVNAGAIFFVLALLATLVLGRWFCGWGCHLVMLQDFCAWIMRRMGIRPRLLRSRVLAWAPFVLAVYMFLWPAVYRWGVIPLSGALHGRFEFIPAIAPPSPWPGFSLAVTTTDLWRTMPGLLVAVPFLLVCGFATVYVLGAKGFCTYGCPYGGFFAPADHYAPGRIRVTDACTQSGHCTAVCTSNVRVHEEVREYGMVVDPGCMKCLDCVSVCPNHALHFGFGPPAAAKGAARHRPPPRRWDFTVGEEVAFSGVFLAVFLALRGVYGLIPMLMAVGLAGCITFMAWKLWRLRRDASVSLHRFRLRFRGHLTRAGVVYALLTAAVLLLTAHSGAVNTLEFLAGRADARVTLTRDRLFSAAPMEMPPAMAAAADRGLGWYKLARRIDEGGIGLLRRPDDDIRRAWLHACRHDFATAEAILREHNDRVGANDFVSRDIALLMGLQLLEPEAEAYARATILAHPDFVETFEVLMRILELDGRFEEAIRTCRAAAARAEAAGEAAAHLFVLRRLSLLLFEHGNLDEAVKVFNDTIEIDAKNAASFVMLARVYAAKGESDLAVETMRRGLALDPDRPDLRREMAGLLEEVGRSEEAGRYRP